MTTLAALTAAAMVALVVRPASGRNRLTAAAVPVSRRWFPRPVPRIHKLVAVLSAFALLLVLGLAWGLPVAAAAVVGVPLALARAEPRADRQRRQRIAADLPLAVDLLAACLRAGRPPGDALAAVAPAVAGPLGARLTEVEQRMRLGADPVHAWAVLDDEPGCAALARAVRRATESGGPLAQTLDHLATDVRQQRRWSADEHARAIETRSVVPLGLCFLPAFVLIGIVPTIAGSLSSLFTVFGS